MKSQVTIWAIVLPLLTCGQGFGGEEGDSDPHARHFLQRFHPVGGWNPYGGGLLHWWNPHCSPCQAAPDDYCRKPLPRLCWPHYPGHYTWAPPEHVDPRGSRFWNANSPD